MIRAAGRALGRGLRRFGGDRRGVGALEFALLAPLLILILVGMNEIVRAKMVSQKVAHATSAIGDLVAQANTLSSSDLDNIFAAGSAIMTPFDAGGLNMRLTSIVADAQNRPMVTWSRGKGMGKLSGQVSGIPTGLVAVKGDSVIYAEATYTYNSPFDISILGFKPIKGLNLSEKAYLRPRRNTVACSNC